MVVGKYAIEMELGAPTSRMWKVARNIDKVAPMLLPHLFGGSELLEGDGGTGTVRVITMGPAFPQGGQYKERVDFFDDEHTTINYTVLKGDPKYKAFKASLQYIPQKDGVTTKAVWSAEYETVGDEDLPPVQNSGIARLIQTTFANYLTANPTQYAEDNTVGEADVTCDDGNQPQNVVLESGKPRVDQLKA